MITVNKASFNIDHIASLQDRDKDGEPAGSWIRTPSGGPVATTLTQDEVLTLIATARELRRTGPPSEGE